MIKIFVEPEKLNLFFASWKTVCVFCELSGKFVTFEGTAVERKGVPSVDCKLLDLYRKKNLIDMYEALNDRK